MDLDTLRNIDSVKLQPTNVKAYPFKSEKPNFAGKFETLFKSKRKFAIATIYVTQEKSGCMVSSSDAKELGLVTLHLDIINAEAAESFELRDVQIKHIEPSHYNLHTLKSLSLVISTFTTLTGSLIPLMSPTRLIGTLRPLPMSMT